MHSIVSGIEFIFRGGFMMYPLLISALIALTVILERILVFHRYYKSSPTLLSSVFEQLKNGQLAVAEENCRKVVTPASSVIIAGLEHFKNPLDEMELCMKNRAEAWVPVLEKRIDMIDTVITAAPLMGLLGTITGMMSSFEVLSEKGVNEPNAITGGVAEALIATATGLVIALVCLVAYNYLTAQVKLFIYEVESVASRLVEIRLAAERKREAVKENSDSL
ncbi:MAG: MotA/TolQ/ExbB proton channel family protein [Bdellovibrionia bacterium]